jgi:predicted RNA binding protein YcfA (HicA-like mRNA interferase family)
VSQLRVAVYHDLRRIAEQVGFMWARCEGSHNIFIHPDGRRIVIPNHGSQVIVRPLVRKLIRDMGLTREEYHQLLDR